MKIKAVLTGDIVNSRLGDSNRWLADLKNTLASFGKTPQIWEIYRGDSFQLIVMPQDALLAAFKLKAVIKTNPALDVRIAIGIGTIIEPAAKRITEANGVAFENSGRSFEQLKKQRLALKSPWQDFDEVMNIMIDLALLTADRWTPTAAEIILYKLRHSEANQTEIAKALQKKGQGTISEGLKRGGYDEIEKLLNFYNKKIMTLCSS